MGMQSGGRDEPITEINVTPLVDVCLVLVIIFMAIAPFAVQAGIKVMQSQTSVGVGKVSSEENVKVELSAGGAIKINGRPMSKAGFFMDLRVALAQSRDKVVIVSADARNKVREVVQILDLSKQAGASRVAILKND